MSSLLLGKICLIVALNLSRHCSDLNWEAVQHHFMILSCDRSIHILLVDTNGGMVNPAKFC